MEAEFSGSIKKCPAKADYQNTMEAGSPAAPDKPHRALAAFFKLLQERQPTEKAAELFLAALSGLPPDIRREMPVLADMARLRTGAGTEASGGAVRERLNRRYIRICFVQEELGKLDFNKAKAGEGLESFVFNHIDFAYYKKIEEKEFTLLYIDGPEDFGEPFFENAFHRNRGAVKAVIMGHYKKIGGFYCLHRENPLILSIMRSLHTSLEFVPLFSFREVLEECTGLVRFLESRGFIAPGSFPNLKLNLTPLFPCLIRALDGIKFCHQDGQQTDLVCIPKNGGETPVDGTPSREKPLILQGIFRPQGKAYTIPLLRLTGKNL